MDSFKIYFVQVGVDPWSGPSNVWNLKPFLGCKVFHIQVFLILNPKLFEGQFYSLAAKLTSFFGIQFPEVPEGLAGQKSKTLVETGRLVNPAKFI